MRGVRGCVKSVVDIRPVDRAFFQRKLDRFVPDRVVDIHTHVWQKTEQTKRRRGHDPRLVSWPSRVADENPVEHLQETYRQFLPGRRVVPLMFATVPSGNDLMRQNAYVAACARRTGYPALVFSDPAWSAEELERRVKAGGFLGAKSYLSMVPAVIPGREIRIFDFFPPHQLEVHDRNGWVVMLHIPRDARLRDPVNLHQLMEIERTYRRLKLIVAHVGRAYANEDVGDAFDVLAGSRRMCFDICANTHAGVFEQLIRCVGAKRILFGTDLPITRMRMRRITKAGHYINLVPRGMYGDVSGDSHMAELQGKAAERLTVFMYEEIEAFRQAAERTGLSRGDVEAVFWKNAVRLLTGAGYRGW